MAKIKTTGETTARQLAQQYGTTAANIRSLNKIDKGTKIKAGTSVRLGKGIGRPFVPSPEAQSLYVDPSAAYQPALDYIQKQMGAANTRYGENQADIKSIFGTLTTVRAEDKAKIQKQFEQSIADQQMNLAARTAEARTGVAAGAEAQQAVAGERGMGPAPAGPSASATAAEEGIARSNEYQTTWQALQNVMSQQAQNDVTAAVRGYDYQQASALEQLKNNLEQRLAGLESQEIAIQGQMAGAKLAGQQQVAQAGYGEAKTKQAQQAALQQASARSTGKGSTGSGSSFGSDYSGIINFAKSKFGKIGANKVAQSIDSIDAGNYKNWQQAYSAWNKQYGNTLTSNKLAVQKRIKKYFQDNYSSTVPSTGNATYSKDIFGLKKRMTDEGTVGIYDKMMGTINAVETENPASASEALSSWKAQASPAELQSGTPYATYYFQNIWKPTP